MDGIDRVDAAVRGMGLCAFEENLRIEPVAAGDGFESASRATIPPKGLEEKARDVGFPDIGSRAGDEEVGRSLEEVVDYARRLAHLGRSACRPPKEEKAQAEIGDLV